MTDAKPVYPDYNATTPLDPEAIDAMRPYLEEHFGNPSSGPWCGARLIAHNRAKPRPRPARVWRSCSTAALKKSCSPAAANRTTMP
jgi:hypothetical protein